MEKYQRVPTADSAQAAFTDLNRALMSLREELEAIDWYSQRAEACVDDALRAVIEHNKDEEVEHAIMLLEWIRRNSPVFDEHIRRYLLSPGAILDGQGPAAEPESVPAIPARPVAD